MQTSVFDIINNRKSVKMNYLIEKLLKPSRLLLSAGVVPFYV